MIALVDVAVPAHRRRQDEIALLHVAAAAVDDGCGALGLRREADGGEGVAMRPRAVAGIQHGECGDQVRGRHGLAAEGRIDQDQGAALDVLDRDLADRALGERLDVLPAPDQRRVLGCGWIGVIFLKRSHSGCRLAASNSSTKDLLSALRGVRWEGLCHRARSSLTSSGLRTSCLWRRHFRQHFVDIGAVDDHVLDEDSRLDFSPLR